ncbi:MAG TPA: transposase, partial [Cyanobacteria bacterium UBA8543]|nr:transposase [Cyanobacteria bacterium UBA8543]
NGRSPLPIRMKPRSLSSFVSGFKSATTRRINLTRNAPGTSVWQRNYYDHIIRNESSLQNIRQYICNNPLSWEVDQLHPDNPSKW